VFGLLMLAGIIDKKEDLRAYYDFWHHVTPNVMHHYSGANRREELENFSKLSYFEF
jgi:hypothetical protein